MLKKNLIANYIGQGWTAIMGLVFIPYYIKYLGIEAYGLIGLFAMLNTWLSLLDMGLAPTLNREMARYSASKTNSSKSIRDLLRSVEYVSISVAIFIFFAISASSHWIATSWLKIERLNSLIVSNSFIVMGLLTSLKFIEGVYHSSIIGLQKQVTYNLVMVVMSTIRGIGAVLIVKLVSPTIYAFFLWQIVVSVITIATLAIITYSNLSYCEIGGRFSKTALKSVGKFAAGVVGGTLLSFFLTQVDKILLSRILNLSDFGYYNLAVGISGSLMILASPITQAWYPKLSQMHASGDNNGLNENFHIGSQLITVLMGSASLVMIFFTKDFLMLWTNDQILTEKISTVVSILVIGNFMSGLNAMPFNLQLAFGWTSLSFYIKLFSVFISIPLVLWASAKYGTVGAAYVWTLITTIYIIIGTPLMFNKIISKERWNWIYKDTILPIFVGIITAILIKSFLPEAKNSTERLIILITAGFLILLSTSLASNKIRLLILKQLKSFMINAA
jgi:O-antigen/teichoic acid export membrane protein